VEGVDGVDSDPNEEGNVGEGTACAGEVESREEAAADTGEEKDSEAD
jgi:hypothetical protein